MGVVILMNSYIVTPPRLYSTLHPNARSASEHAWVRNECGSDRRGKHLQSRVEEVGFPVRDVSIPRVQCRIHDSERGKLDKRGAKRYEREGLDARSVVEEVRDPLCIVIDVGVSASGENGQLVVPHSRRHIAARYELSYGRNGGHVGRHGSHGEHRIEFASI